MCGIYGAIGTSFASSPSELLRHRGPDGAGERALRAPDGAPGLLGHRRLAILDLSEAASQPMGNEDGSIWITFNGEIYNFECLRHELLRLGHRFASQSDTEVLLHGYEQWDEELLPRLVGMFAFAIWDTRRHKLLLARDRLGKKPLFYWQDGHRFVFASEIKAVLAARGVPAEPDLEALDRYLTYFYFPPPYTAFRQIRKLEPATWLRVTFGSNGRLLLHSQRYWDPLAAAPRQQSFDQGCTEVHALLSQAIRQRLISDVPLGAFLSGGLDSSTIVALAACDAGRRLDAFSVSFPGNPYYDEIPQARRVAARYAASANVLPVAAGGAELLPKVISHFDEPFGNPTAVLQYLLTRETRKYVTVALSGDGGDELFLGYHRHRGAKLAARLRSLPRPLHAGARHLAKWVPEATSGWQTPRRLREFLQYGALPEEQSYLAWVGYFSEDEKQSLYTGALRAAVPPGGAGEFLRVLFSQAAALPPGNRLSYVDLFSFLSCNVLEYADRMSMANSLEVRCPFTDHRLVEAVLKLPPTWKIHRGQPKYLLRKIAAGYLPPDLLARPKQGFSPPLERWISGEMKHLLDAWLGPIAVARRGCFIPEEVARLRHQHAHGQRDNSVRLWGLLALEAWFRRYVDKDSEDSLKQEIIECTRSASVTAPATVI